MVERFGMQDHDVGIGSTRLQNPTNPHVHTMPGAADYSQGAQNFQYSAGVFAPDMPLHKNIVKAALLALLCGPFGLLYTTWRGGALLIALTALAGRIHGGSFDAISNEDVMHAIWPFSVSLSVVWTILAAIAYNRRGIENYNARKEKLKAEQAEQASKAKAV